MSMHPLICQAWSDVLITVSSPWNESVSQIWIQYPKHEVNNSNVWWLGIKHEFNRKVPGISMQGAVMHFLDSNYIDSDFFSIHGGLVNDKFALVQEEISWSLCFILISMLLSLRQSRCCVRSFCNSIYRNNHDSDKARFSLHVTLAICLINLSCFVDTSPSLRDHRNLGYFPYP